MSRPLVSVIIATYNRSQILKYSLTTLLKQDCTNFEAIIVGDACTDDTVEVVKSFNDPRFHFHNLKKNCGEQSGPNNEGLKLAKGEYIAFLNHDDLWFPNHLNSSITTMNESNLQFVYSYFLSSMGYGRPMTLGGVSLKKTYDLHHFFPASSWLFRRDIAEVVGPWKNYRQSYGIPSQDWLYRAHKKKIKIGLSPHVGVICIHSGSREKSYVNKTTLEHQFIFDQMTKPQFLEQALLTMLDAELCQFRRNESLKVPLVLMAKNMLKKFLCLLGIRMEIVKHFILYRRKGGFIKHLRKVRGLPEISH